MEQLGLINQSENSDPIQKDSECENVSVFNNGMNVHQETEVLKKRLEEVWERLAEVDEDEAESHAKQVLESLMFTEEMMV